MDLHQNGFLCIQVQRETDPTLGEIELNMHSIIYLFYNQISTTIKNVNKNTPFHNFLKHFHFVIHIIVNLFQLFCKLYDNILQQA